LGISASQVLEENLREEISEKSDLSLSLSLCVPPKTILNYGLQQEHFNQFQQNSITKTIPPRAGLLCLFSLAPHERMEISSCWTVELLVRKF
jgi:hypothetical protein